MSETVTLTTPEDEESKPSISEALNKLSETTDIGSANKIISALQKQPVTLQGDTGEQAGSITGASLQFNKESQSMSWAIRVEAQKTDPTTGKTIVSVDTIPIEELIAWQQDTAEPETGTGSETSAEDEHNRFVDEELLNSSEKVQVKLSDSANKAQEEFVHSWNTTKREFSKKTDIRLGAKKFAYQRAKKSYLAKKERAEKTQNRWVKAHRTKRVKKASQKLKDKRQTLVDHIRPKNEQFVADKRKLHEMANNHEVRRTEQIQSFLDKRTEAEARKATRKQLKAEGYGFRERRAAAEAIFADPDKAAATKRAGRRILEAQVDRKMYGESKKQYDRLDNLSEYYSQAYEKATSQIHHMEESVTETEQTIQTLGENIATSKQDLLDLFEHRRLATVNDDIEGINKQITGIQKHIEELEDRQFWRKKQLKDLSTQLETTKKQRDKAAADLRKTQEKSLQSNDVVTKKQEALYDSVTARTKAVDDLLS